MKKPLLYFIFLVSYLNCFSQNIDLYQQLNGNYDYKAIGATLNPIENNEIPSSTPCTINTTASATLTLNSNETVKKAYLYWAGSGTGDFNIKLNGIDVAATRTFSYSENFSSAGDLDFFSAFADVTSQVINMGSGVYTISELDLTQAIIPNCTNKTNFGGWALMIIYEDLSLPLNQINIYDGLQAVSATKNSIQIILNNLNVIDNLGSKIGFLAWEGDQDPTIAINETLRINGNILSNPPLNPANNAFNGTNSFTMDSNFYNMDLDFYDVENYINIGDATANIELTSGNGVSGDFIMVNNIITVFNSTLPDPKPEIIQIQTTCNSRDIDVNYTVDNINGTEDLPSGVSVKFFANNALINEVFTPNLIPVGAAESFQMVLTIPNSIPSDFNLGIEVNFDNSKNSIIPELNNTNNTDDTLVNLKIATIENPSNDLEVCDDVDNDEVEIFDFSLNTNLAVGNQTDVSVNYFLSLNDAENDKNPILNTTAYQNTQNPQEIFIKIQSLTDPDCYEIDSFFLIIHDLPIAGKPDDLFVCDTNEIDGIASFDLTQNNTLITSNQQGVNINYHLTLSDAQNGTNPIRNSTNFENTNNPQTIYASITNLNFEDCMDITSFILSVKDINITEIDGDLKCDIGFDSNEFDLSEITQQITLSSDESISGYFLNFLDANNFENAINSPLLFSNTINPQTIYVRIDSNLPNKCQQIYFFDISTEHCEPFIPEGFSPNGDGINDTFYIKGLYDIFENFELQIFNRYGSLIYKGNNNVDPWDGTSNKGLNNVGKKLPTGTYFYLLNLKDPKFGLYKGWVYLNR